MSKLFFILLIAVGYFLPLSAFSQAKTHTFEEIDSLQQTEKRIIVVFIHTDWCKFCNTMKNTTFKDENIAQLLNENFWFADLDAEETKDITFSGHTFKYKPTGRKTGIHELAEQLGTIDGKIAFPTLCILNSNHEIIFQYGQFLSSEGLQKVLTEIVNSQ